MKKYSPADTAKLFADFFTEISREPVLMYLFVVWFKTEGWRLLCCEEGKIDDGVAKKWIS